MNLKDAHPGYPFEGDYRLYEPDRDGGQQILAEPARDLEQRGQDIERRRSILQRLCAVREEIGYRRISFMCREDGSDVLFASDEIITSPAALRDPAVGRIMRRHNFDAADEVGRRVPDQLMRLRKVNPQPQLEHERIPDDLAEIIATLRHHGHPASLEYCLTQADAVGKAQGDPEPVDDPVPPPLGDYRKGFPQAAHPIVVAAIDGGVSAAVRGDGWLFDVPLNSMNVDPIDVAPHDGIPDAMAGHGERVLGVIQQVAPYACLRMYRVADTLGFAFDSDIAAAIEQAVRDGAQILNISLAGAIVPNMPPLATTTMIAQLTRKYGDELAIVAAAGNFGNTALTYPAAAPNVVSVGGLTSQLQPTTWSTRGWVMMSTGSEGILSTYIDSVYPPANPDRWARSTGTSFAAPQIAGAIARMCYEAPNGMTPGAALAKLISLGMPVPDFGTAVQILPGLP
jgi:hypothetical protein